MSFFGLTHLGYQNTVKEQSNAAQLDPIRSKTQLGFLALPPLRDRNPPPRSIVPINQTSQYGKGHGDSFVEWTRLRTKHTRNPAGPSDIFQRPVTTTHGVGWWTRDEGLKREDSWAYVPRKKKINSEMTRLDMWTTKCYNKEELGTNIFLRFSDDWDDCRAMITDRAWYVKKKQDMAHKE